MRYIPFTVKSESYSKLSSLISRNYPELFEVAQLNYKYEIMIQSVFIFFYLPHHHQATFELMIYGIWLVGLKQGEEIHASFLVAIMPYASVLTICKHQFLVLNLYHSF